jgi:hypothetical protein
VGNLRTIVAAVVRDEERPNPPGQQPVCKGGGLEQEPALNPAGHAPPGQQPEGYGPKGRGSPHEPRHFSLPIHRSAWKVNSAKSNFRFTAF